MTNSNLSDVSGDIKAEIDYFKSQVKSLIILDNHLDAYKNPTNETITTSICYNSNGKMSSSDEFIGFIGALQGENYSNCNFSKPAVQKASEERLNQYIAESRSLEID